MESEEAPVVTQEGKAAQSSVDNFWKTYHREKQIDQEFSLEAELKAISQKSLEEESYLPKDKFYLVQLSFFLLGLGLLIPLNAFIFENDYYEISMAKYIPLFQYFPTSVFLQFFYNIGQVLGTSTMILILLFTENQRILGGAEYLFSTVPGFGSAYLSGAESSRMLPDADLLKLEKTGHKELLYGDENFGNTLKIFLKSVLVFTKTDQIVVFGFFINSCLLLLSCVLIMSQKIFFGGDVFGDLSGLEAVVKVFFLIVSCLVNLSSGFVTGAQFCTVMGLVSVCPFFYTETLLVGCGFGGVIVSTLSIIFELFWRRNLAISEAEQCSLFLFAAFCELCFIVCFLFMTKLPLIKVCRRRSHVERVEQKQMRKEFDERGVSALKLILGKKDFYLGAAPQFKKSGDEDKMVASNEKKSIFSAEQTDAMDAKRTKPSFELAQAFTPSGMKTIQRDIYYNILLWAQCIIKVLSPGLSLFFTFAWSFLFYPDFFLEVAHKLTKEDPVTWQNVFPKILFAAFTYGDFFGRLMSAMRLAVPARRLQLAFVVILRIIVYACLTVMIWFEWFSPLFTWILLFLFAAIHGYVACHAMVLAPDGLAVTQKKKGDIVMTLFWTCGIAFGTTFSLILNSAIGAGRAVLNDKIVF